MIEMSQLLFALGRYPESVQLLDEGEAVASRVGDTANRVRILGWRAHVSGVLGQLTDAAHFSARAHETVTELGDPAMLLRTAHFLGQAQFNLGRLEAAERVLADAQARAPENPDASVGFLGSMPVLVAGTRTMTLALLGRFTAAAETVASAMRYAKATRHPYDVAFVHSVDGIRLLQCVDPTAATETIESGLAVATDARIVQLLPPLRIGLGHAHLLRNDLPAAYTVLSEGLEEARARKRHMMLIWAAAGLAMTELRLGHPARAEESATEAVIVADRFGYRAFKVMAARTLGLVLLQRPDRRQAAHATLDAALALANELDMQAEIAHCHAALARAGGASAARHREVAEIGYGRLGIATAAAVTGGFAEHAAIVRLVPAQS
jgi:tetratricopeptide (TPR) repeat protein